MSAASLLDPTANRGVCRASFRGLPREVWNIVLGHLAPLEVACPVALTCKSFFDHAKSRIDGLRRKARSIELRRRFEFGDNFVLLRLDRKRGRRLFVVRTVTPNEAYVLDVWDIQRGKVESSVLLPEPLAPFPPEELQISPDGVHIAISYHKAVALIRYDATRGCLTIIRGYELDSEDDENNDDTQEPELETVATRATFSTDGKFLAIAHMQALLDGDRIVRISAARDPVATQLKIASETFEPVPEIVSGPGMLKSTAIESQYDERMISLEDVQVNPDPFQILIPPNRIADAGVVIGSPEEGSEWGSVLKEVPSFYEDQILRFSPDNKTLLETRELLLDETTYTTVIFNCTESSSPGNPYGTDYSTSDEQAAKVDLLLRGDILSLQFSSDSSALFLLYGWNHGAREHVSCIQGWAVIRRCSRVATVVEQARPTTQGPVSQQSVARNPPRSNTIDEYETSLTVFRAATAARVSSDCTVLYAQDASDGRWGAWDVLTGKRLWTEECDASEDANSVAGKREVITAEESDGFIVLDEHDGGQWKMHVYR